MGVHDLILEADTCDQLFSAATTLQAAGLPEQEVTAW